MAGLEAPLGGLVALVEYLAGEDLGGDDGRLAAGGG